MTQEIEHIQIDANRSDEEPFRLERLHRIVGYVCALADHYGNAQVLSKISKLYDHKGHLTVTWNSSPTKGEKDFFKDAWFSVIGDCSDSIDHVAL